MVAVAAVVDEPDLRTETFHHALRRSGLLLLFGWALVEGLGAVLVIPANAALIAGDLLVTADGRFPAGIPVARVAEDAEAEVGFSLITKAAPEAELSRVDYVKVLVFTSDQVGSPAGEDDDPVQPPLETTTTAGTEPGSGTTTSP